MKYYIKDLIINKDRFDAWTALALTTNANVLKKYLENVCNFIILLNFRLIVYFYIFQELHFKKFNRNRRVFKKRIFADKLIS